MTHDDKGALRSNYDVLLVDLDGTLFRGSRAIDGAYAALAARAQPVLYVTNNASRSAAEVAEHLVQLGFSADEAEVVTSAQAAARLLAQRVAPGADVLVVGTDSLAAEVELVGLRPVRAADPQPAAVVQGHSTSTAWPILAEAAFAIRGGALWVAANTDTTLPMERGLAPGNGSMVAALRAATDAEPTVAGKPYAPLLEDALRRNGSRRALVVGDRLDTDIAGANTVGLDSLLVLTGVASAEQLLCAEPHLRPTHIALGLDALNTAPLTAAELAQWTARAVNGTDILLTYVGADGAGVVGTGDGARQAGTGDGAGPPGAGGGAGQARAGGGAGQARAGGGAGQARAGDGAGQARAGDGAGQGGAGNGRPPAGDGDAGSGTSGVGPRAAAAALTVAATFAWANPGTVTVRPADPAAQAAVDAWDAARRP